MELIDYCSEHPPAHIILGMVHLKHQPKAPSMSETDTLSQIRELSQQLGPSEMVPDRLRDLASWAESQTSQMHKPRVN